MIRLFVALPLEDSVQALLGGLGATIPGARAVPTNQLHLTLRFIGEVDGALFLDIKERLSQVETAPLTIKIKGVGHFPPRGKPRVIWAGIEPADEVQALCNRVNRALADCGIPPEERKFHAHVTLARLQETSTGRVANFLASNSLLESPPFTVETMTLYSSKLTQKGAIHVAEAHYRL